MLKRVAAVVVLLVLAMPAGAVGHDRSDGPLGETLDSHVSYGEACFVTAAYMGRTGHHRGVARCGRILETVASISYTWLRIGIRARSGHLLESFVLVGPSFRFYIDIGHQ